MPPPMRCKAPHGAATPRAEPGPRPVRGPSQEASADEFLDQGPASAQPRRPAQRRRREAPPQDAGARPGAACRWEVQVGMAHSISMAEIKRRYYSAVGGHNNHWFDASTRRFFNDRLPTQGWEGPGGVFFYHSIQFHGSDGYVAPRQYKV